VDRKDVKIVRFSRVRTNVLVLTATSSTGREVHSSMWNDLVTRRRGAVVAARSDQGGHF
jgi:hypothetical protein